MESRYDYDACVSGLSRGRISSSFAQATSRPPKKKGPAVATGGDDRLAGGRPAGPVRPDTALAGMKHARTASKERRGRGGGWRPAGRLASVRIMSDGNREARAGNFWPSHRSADRGGGRRPLPIQGHRATDDKDTNCSTCRGAYDAAGAGGDPQRSTCSTNYS